MLQNICFCHEGVLSKLNDLTDINLETLAPKAYYWIDVFNPSVEELNSLASIFLIHELAIEDASKGNQRPKLDEYDHHLFISMPLFELNKANTQAPYDVLEVNTGQIHLFASKKYIITIRHQTQHQFDEVRLRLHREPELIEEGTGFLLYVLLDKIVDTYMPLMLSFEEAVDAIEPQLFEHGMSRHNLKRLYQLKQTVTFIKRQSLPTLETLEKLHGGLVPMIARPFGEYYRDVIDHMQRFESSVDFVYESVNTAIQVTLSMSTIEDSDITKRLGAWAGIIAVPTAMAGIWGMNFDVMPETKSIWGYPFALFIMACVCVILYRRFKRLKWL